MPSSTNIASFQAIMNISSTSPLDTSGTISSQLAPELIATAITVIVAVIIFIAITVAIFISCLLWSHCKQLNQAAQLKGNHNYIYHFA